MFKANYGILVLVSGMILSLFGGCGSPIIIGPSAPPTSTYTPVPPTHTPTPAVTRTFTPLPTLAATGTFTPLPTHTFTPVPPTFTNTPTSTNTYTPTPTSTPTFIGTTSPTPCQTYIPWADKGAPGSIAVTFSSGTIFQSYVVSQPAKLLWVGVDCNYVSAGATLQLGVYADNGGLPSTLIYSTPPQQAYPYSNIDIGQFPYGGVTVSAGTYWIAVSPISGSIAMVLAPGSAAYRTTVPGTMPTVVSASQANPNPANPTQQVYMEGYLSTCF